MNTETTGQFVQFNNERYYQIENIDQMPAFFMSIVSHSDHWLFVSSNTGLTAGRVSADAALFPYEAVDKIEDSVEHSGNKTIIRVKTTNGWVNWEPFSGLAQQGVQRNLYKHILGNKLCFEERNGPLNLDFRFTWCVSDEFGFVIESELINHASEKRSIEILDGLQNILPAAAPTEVQTNASNLVDAYRLNEQIESSSLAVFSLYSGITDKPEPLEVLKANTVFQLGLDTPSLLLCSRQVNAFRAGKPIHSETQIRGIRGAYLAVSSIDLNSNEHKTWKFVANVNQSQSQVFESLNRLKQTPQSLSRELDQSVENGVNHLHDLIAQVDGFQHSSAEMDDVHHYANVLFNAMRGGVVDNQYWINSADFSNDIRHFNHPVYERHAAFLNALPECISLFELREKIAEQNDLQLERLGSDYLPITFGRRHGDPSRPWNKFAIRIKDDFGNRILGYEGNWRDIFQNWEALLLSYPSFIENVISKFVNASTVDGYNPYRISKKGIDWEIEDPKDPWSYIGYWGDHQIIYLLKLLELSQKYHPKILSSLLSKSVYSYANVPYRIVPFEALLRNPKDTVRYSESEEEMIQQRVKTMGADGKLILDSTNQVYQVNLLEKLLVPLLSKLSNFVLRGGIWLNTQRPEWNDANNALVGQGLSMVTLYYIRRYVTFMLELIEGQHSTIDCSYEVVNWFSETADILQAVCQHLIEQSDFSDAYRFDVLSKLGQAGSDYRQQVYQARGFSGKGKLDIAQLKTLLNNVTTLLDDSIHQNQRNDRLYNAYNLLGFNNETLSVATLYQMLEGQVSALSSGTLSPDEGITMLESLFASDMFRADQKTFMLYPDVIQTPFLQKNHFKLSPHTKKAVSPLLSLHNQSIIIKDLQQNNSDAYYRFHPDVTHLGVLETKMAALKTQLGNQYKPLEAALKTLYQETFNHAEFTGRSHGMFGFEGLGCIYWHMASKLLLATQENFYRAVKNQSSSQTLNKLGTLYYQIRSGIGFNKTPLEYGAFPYDPYSHTPKHSGAQQPGMTGQVKEEVLTRFGELGIDVIDGVIHFSPLLLRKKEFRATPSEFEYLALSGERETLKLAERSLSFTLCQVPIIYRLTDSHKSIQVEWKNGKIEQNDAMLLNEKQSEAVFNRTGDIRKIEVAIEQNTFLF